MSLTLGIDVGGTKIAAGVVDADGSVVASLRAPTPVRNYRKSVATIAGLVAELSSHHAISAVGVGAAGFIASDRSSVTFAALLGWAGVDLGNDLRSLTGLPVVVENDANAAAWAELRFGAARGAHSAVVLTIGTGIGGGLIVEDRLVRGAHGVAGEVGHIRIVPEGRSCDCGLRGCWERYASGTALVQTARDLAIAEPGSASTVLKLAGGDPNAITGEQVTQAAKAGDRASTEAFSVVGHWLGQGMADLGAVFDPEVFVLAGGVAEAGELLLRPSLDSFTRYLTARSFRSVPEVLLATLGNSGGIIGAADLARQ